MTNFNLAEALKRESLVDNLTGEDSHLREILELRERIDADTRWEQTVGQIVNLEVYS